MNPEINQGINMADSKGTPRVGAPHDDIREFVWAVSRALEILDHVDGAKVDPGEVFMIDADLKRLEGQLQECVATFVTRAQYRRKARPSEALKTARKDKSFQSFMASQCLSLSD